MKVICPECAAEYDVPAPMLGETGRRVRCSQCGHIWLASVQDEQDSAFGGFKPFDESMNIEPIPMSVHPDDDDMAHGHDGPGVFSGLNWGYLGRLLSGFAVAALIFALLLGVGVAAHLNQGALRPFFAPFGLAGALPLSPLAIRDVQALARQDAAGQPVLTIQGHVHNNGHKAAKVPLIEITLLSESGAEGDSQQVEPGVNTLDGGQDMTFKATMSGGAAPGDRIRVRFIPRL